jgi:hypothetical protein
VACIEKSKSQLDVEYKNEWYFLHLVLYLQLWEGKLLARVSVCDADDCIHSQSVTENPSESR